MNGADTVSTMKRLRTLPSATGANSTSPQVRYQGWTTGPRMTNTSSVRPRAVSCPMRSDSFSSQMPAATATSSPIDLVTERIDA